MYRWGTCIPSSCTAGDLKAVLRDTLPLHGVKNELLCQVREDRPYETQELVTMYVPAALLARLFAGRDARREPPPWGPRIDVTPL